MAHWRNYGIHKGIFIWPALWVSLAWGVHAFLLVSHSSPRLLGILPGQWQQWWGIWTFPWAHGSWNHLVSNTISLFFVGALVRYSFPSIFDKVWLAGLLLPGIGMFFFARPNYHIGASAWLYALVFFVFFSGLIRLHTRLLAQSMLMVFLYGSFVWGVLPHDPTVSWEGHLMGALVGLMCALYYRKQEPIVDLRNPVYPEEEVPWDDWKLEGGEEQGDETIADPAGQKADPSKAIQFRYVYRKDDRSATN